MKYNYAPGDVNFPNDTLYVVNSRGTITSTYSDCLKCGCKYWHDPIGMADGTVSISKCKARKLLKAWNPTMELPV